MTNTPAILTDVHHMAGASGSKLPQFGAFDKPEPFR
jgi:hypothetical protein